jgi:hypothetical protein
MLILIPALVGVQRKMLNVMPVVMVMMLVMMLVMLLVMLLLLVTIDSKFLKLFP